MALLLRRGALDEEIVKHTFFYWIDHYYEAANDFIAERQKVNPLIWKDLTKLLMALDSLAPGKPYRRWANVDHYLFLFL